MQDRAFKLRCDKWSAQTKMSLRKISAAVAGRAKATRISIAVTRYTGTRICFMPRISLCFTIVSVPTDNIKRSYKLFPPSKAVQDLACATETNSSWPEIRRDRNVSIIVTFPNGR